MPTTLAPPSLFSLLFFKLKTGEGNQNVGPTEEVETGKTKRGIFTHMGKGIAGLPLYSL